MENKEFSLTYADCNSLNAIAGILRHSGNDNAAYVLLAIQKKISDEIEKHEIYESEVM